MMRKYLAVLGIVGLSFASALLLTASSVSAAQFKSGDKCSSNFLGLPTWYRGLDREGCNIVMPSSGRDGQNLQDFIFIIILNVIDIVLRIIGYAAVGFVIYGGFKYLTSAGSADRIAAGKKIIQNALIGLVISFFSVAIVNLIANNVIK